MCFFLSLFFFLKKNPVESSEPPSGWSGGRHARLSAWEANLARKQESHYREEDGEHEEHVRGADHRVVGQLVRLPPHLVDVEAYGEDERRHAEQDHWEEGARQESVSQARALASGTQEQSVTLAAFHLDWNEEGGRNCGRSGIIWNIHGPGRNRGPVTKTVADTSPTLKSVNLSEGGRSRRLRYSNASEDAPRVFDFASTRKLVISSSFSASLQANHAVREKKNQSFPEQKTYLECFSNISVNNGR